MLYQKWDLETRASADEHLQRLSSQIGECLERYLVYVNGVEMLHFEKSAGGCGQNSCSLGPPYIRSYDQGLRYQPLIISRGR